MNINQILTKSKWPWWWKRAFQTIAYRQWIKASNSFYRINIIHSLKRFWCSCNYAAQIWLGILFNLVNWKLFSLSKNKARRLILRAPTSFQNLIAREKKFIQLNLQFLVYPGLMRVGESSKHWHQIMHFITKVATITSRKVIMKDWLRKYRSKGQ